MNKEDNIIELLMLYFKQMNVSKIIDEPIINMDSNKMSIKYKQMETIYKSYKSNTFEGFNY
jgi:hypothetical protein